MSPLKVAIIGAGPAGLILARLLSTPSSPSLTITDFESDPSPTSRTQGGTSRPSPQNRPPGPKTRRTRYPVPRTRSLTFEKGDVRKGFDLVIGADGGWSKVRSTFLDHETKPAPSRIMGYEFSVPDAKEKATQEWEFVNMGSVFAYGDGKSIVAQQLGNGSLHVSTWRTVEHVHEGAMSLTKSEVLEAYEDWAAELRSIVDLAENNKADARSLYALPEGYRWKHRPRVTLLGDAAHLMLPFAGESVNLAFEDAMKLSEAILKGVEGKKEELDQNIREYEEKMFQRSTKAQKLTNGMTNAMFFTKGAPRTSIESYVMRRLEYDFPLVSRLMYPFLVAALYGGYFVFKWFN